MKYQKSHIFTVIAMSAILYGCPNENRWGADNFQAGNDLSNVSRARYQQQLIQRANYPGSNRNNSRSYARNTTNNNGRYSYDRNGTRSNASDRRADYSRRYNSQRLEQLNSRPISTPACDQVLRELAQTRGEASAATQKYCIEEYGRALVKRLASLGQVVRRNRQRRSFGNSGQLCSLVSSISEFGYDDVRTLSGQDRNTLLELAAENIDDAAVDFNQHLSATGKAHDKVELFEMPFGLSYESTADMPSRRNNQGNSDSRNSALAQEKIYIDIKGTLVADARTGTVTLARVQSSSSLADSRRDRDRDERETKDRDRKRDRDQQRFANDNGCEMAVTVLEDFAYDDIGDLEADLGWNRGDDRDRFSRDAYTQDRYRGDNRNYSRNNRFNDNYYRDRGSAYSNMGNRTGSGGLSHQIMGDLTRQGTQAITQGLTGVIDGALGNNEKDKVDRQQQQEQDQIYEAFTGEKSPRREQKNDGIDTSSIVNTGMNWLLNGIFK